MHNINGHTYIVTYQGINNFLFRSCIKNNVIGVFSTSELKFPFISVLFNLCFHSLYEKLFSQHP